MATRRVARSESIDDQDSDDAAQSIPGTRQLLSSEPPPILDMSPGERVIALLEGMGDDEKTTVRLYRRTPNSSALTWCQTYTAAEFIAGDFEMIRTEWGAGDYEIRVYGAGGLASRENVSIAQRANPAPATNANQQSSELARIMQTMAESQSRILESLQARPDPQAQMMQTITMMSAIREAMGINPVAPAQQKSAVETMTELAAAMRAMKELSGELSPAKEPDLENPMSMLPGIIDLVKTAISSRNAGGDVPLIAAPASLDYAANPADPKPNATVPADSHAAPETPIDEPETDEAEMQLVQMLIKNYIGQLIKMIAAGKTPIEGGTFIYEKLPDQFVAALDSPDWFDQLVTFDPRLKPHGEWLKAAKVEADRLFAEDDAG